MSSTPQMAIIQKNTIHASTSVIKALEIAKKTGVDPFVLRNGKKYRLVTINPSNLDGDNLPASLKKRLTTMYK